MFAASGKHIFFADADRAMPFTEFQKIFERYTNLAETFEDLIVVGSRAHLEEVSFKTKHQLKKICSRERFEKKIS